MSQNSSDTLIRRFTAEEYEVGSRRIAGLPAVGGFVDFLVLFPAGNPDIGQGEKLVLDRFTATRNSLVGDDNPALPSSDPTGSLRAYFIPYTLDVCKIKDRQTTADDAQLLLDWVALLRKTPRVPLSGWYPGEPGERELSDTNFAQGHDVPIMKAGNAWCLVLASQTSTPTAEVVPFSITLDWALRKNPAYCWEG